MRRECFLAGATALLVFGPAVEAAEFTGLGIPFAEVHGISADGKYVVGVASDLPFRWTLSTGLQSLPEGPGGELRGQANAASSDGSFIVGFSSTAAIPLNEAVRWVDGGATFGLGELAGGAANSEAVDVSFDGSVIVGKSVSNTGVTAFRRTEAGGMQGLGGLGTGVSRSEAFAVSGNGAVVVGSATSPSPSSGLFGEAFRWTEADGMKGLGHLPSATGVVGSVAYDASQNGAVIVGVSSVLQNSGLQRSEAFRWTEESGMVGLGDLEGNGFHSAAYGVSADGALIIGSGRSAAGERAFLWDDAHGMRDLQSLLASDYGLGTALAGWTLQSARAISADGLYLAGMGRNPDGLLENWYVDLNAPVLPGDANGDGKADLADFGILKANFGSGTTLAQGDFTGDGKVDLGDFAILKENFGESGSVATPEPSTYLLAILAGLGLLAIRRHSLASRQR